MSNTSGRISPAKFSELHRQHAVDAARTLQPPRSTYLATPDFLRMIGTAEGGRSTAVDNDGLRRLDSPNDFVRVEIATALRRDIRVVPILLDGAQMPNADSLPEDLKPLLRRQALALDFRRFGTEMTRLITAIRRILESPRSVTKSPPIDICTPPVSAEPAAAAPEISSPVSNPSTSGETAASASNLGEVLLAGTPEINLVSGPSPDPSRPPETPNTRKLWLFAAGATGVLVLFAMLHKAEPAPAPAQPSPGHTFQDCPDCPKMMAIPPGEFEMGSSENEFGGRPNERPRRHITVQAFAISTTEVTQSQWVALMRENPSEFKQCGLQCPVERVSWNDAQEFIRLLNLRTARKTYSLPSEAQWEYAARARMDTAFHTGATITTEQANFDGTYSFSSAGTDVLSEGSNTKDRYRQTTVKVGTFPANDFGLHDMHGNVAEWVQDCYADYSGTAPIDGSAYQLGGCPQRVNRGGSWYGGPVNARAASRLGEDPNKREKYVGFRVACALPCK